MPRVIVVDDSYQPLMDEYATPDHLRDGHSALQLMERLAWAINDAHERIGSRPRRKSARRVEEIRRAIRPR